MIVVIRFSNKLFSKWPLAAILDFPIFKKSSKLTKVHPQILKVDILGHKSQSLKTVYTKFTGLAKKSCLAIKKYFLY